MTAGASCIDFLPARRLPRKQLSLSEMIANAMIVVTVPAHLEGRGTFFTSAMFAVFQLPFADVRGFLNQTSPIQRSMGWPSPSYGSFVKSFGGVKPRPLGGTAVGESTICDCRKGIRFESLPFISNIWSSIDAPMSRCAFRRLFSDGLAMAKVEVGFAIGSWDDEFPSDASMIRQLKRVLNARVSISNPGVAPRQTNLIRSGGLIADAYRRATSKSSDTDDTEETVVSGTPLVFVEVKLERLSTIADALNLQRAFIQNASEAEIYVGQLNVNGSWSKIILQGSGRSRDWNQPTRILRDLRRNFRIPFLRCYADLQALTHTLRWFGAHSPDPESVDKKSLEEYLCRSIKRITKSSKSSAVAASRCKRACVEWMKLEREQSGDSWSRRSNALQQLKDQVVSPPKKQFNDVTPSEVQLLASHVHSQAMLSEIKDAFLFAESLITRKNVLRQLARVKYVLTEANSESESYGYIATAGDEFDAFISHASEDKDDFVKPLAMALQQLGFRIWYDEFQIKAGDSLYQSIDDGLANSRYGIVILSPAFFEKEWTKKELGALLASETQGGNSIIPILHHLSPEDVNAKSPLLSDKFAVSSGSASVDEIANLLADIFLCSDDDAGDEIF